MAPAKAAENKGEKTVYSTTGTVSAPVDLDDLVPKGEHTAVKLGTTKNIRPKPKVTLTSLTTNNVRWTLLALLTEVWNAEEDQLGRHPGCLFRQVLQRRPGFELR